MTTCQAVSRRVKKLLDERNMSQYRLELNSGILHGTMNNIMKGNNKSIKLNTVMMIAFGFNMSITEFLNDPVFLSNEELEIE